MLTFRLAFGVQTTTGTRACGNGTAYNEPDDLEPATSFRPPSGIHGVHHSPFSTHSRFPCTVHIQYRSPHHTVAPTKVICICRQPLPYLLRVHLPMLLSVYPDTHTHTHTHMQFIHAPIDIRSLLLNVSLCFSLSESAFRTDGSNDGRRGSRCVSFDGFKCPSILDRSCIRGKLVSAKLSP